MIDVAKIDSQIRFLVNESAYLRQNHKRATWAETKAGQFDAIAETLRKVRQDQQMTGLGGQRIG